MTIFSHILCASLGVPRGVAILAARTAHDCRLEAYTTRSRRALTLVEMLVGMAITLVMMAAVVNLFANISEGVRNRRATMEVSANLRIARSQLFNDLAGATCLKYPKNTHGVMPKPDSNNPPDGYFEIVEGEYSDDNPSLLLDGVTAPNNPELDYGVSLVPSGGEVGIAMPLSTRTPLASDVTNGGGLGDYDDILAMTVENEADKFRGKGRGLRPGGNPANIGTPPDYTNGDWVDMAISSPVAEVVWFAIENPTDRSQGEPGMRKIYRRTVLVAPWYGTETKTINGNPVTGTDPLLDLTTRNILTHQAQLNELRRVQEEYDISLRLENGRLVPNSLADLARRENRFAHSPNDSITPVNYFPHLFPYDVDSPSFTETPNEADSSLRQLGDEREGEDLILNNVLAFDLQIYDPGAPLYQYQGSIIQPSGTLNGSFLNAIASGSATLTGFGTYADLGWNDGGQYAAVATSPTTLFQQERRLGWHPFFQNNLRGTPAVYDTWSTYYETDQINQEEALFYTQPQSTLAWDPTWQVGVIDQGANGLDENGINGPDDPLERETSPPYPSPLYGVQVKLRVYEPESRQIRETTVTRNLAK